MNLLLDNKYLHDFSTVASWLLYFKSIKVTLFNGQGKIEKINSTAFNASKSITSNIVFTR